MPTLRGARHLLATGLLLAFCATAVWAYDECAAGTLQSYCVHTAPNEDDCTMLDVVLEPSGGNPIVGTAPLSGAFGGGLLVVGCETTLSVCSTCIDVTHVEETEEGVLEYCMQATTSCAGRRSVTDLGCSSHPCASTGDNDCNGHGTANGVSCNCEDGYHGESCELSITDDHCFMFDDGERQTPVVCSNVYTEVCDMVYTLVIGDVTQRGRIDIDQVLENQVQELDPPRVCSQMNECSACTYVVNIAREGQELSYQVLLELDCGAGALVYPFYTDTAMISNACQSDCDFNSSDRAAVSGNTSLLTIPVPSWYYTYLLVDRDEPLADVQLRLDVALGDFDVYVKENCRPAEDDYDMLFGANSNGRYSHLMDADCDSSLSQQVGEEELFYFGFHCRDSPCRFFYEIVAHTVERVSVSQQGASHYVPSGTEYYYFEFVPVSADGLTFTLSIDAHDDTEVHASVYMQVDGCADKQNGGYVVTTETPAANADTIDYTIDFHPAQFDAVGHVVGVTVYVIADCADRPVCSILKASLDYSRPVGFSASATPSPSSPGSPSPLVSPTPTSSRSTVAGRSPSPAPSASASATRSPTASFTTRQSHSPSQTHDATLPISSNVSPGSESEGSDGSGISSGISPGTDSDGSVGQSTQSIETWSYVAATSGGTVSDGETPLDLSPGITDGPTNGDETKEIDNSWVYISIAVCIALGCVLLAAIVVVGGVLVAKKRKQGKFLYARGVDSDGLRLDDGDFEL